MWVRPKQSGRQWQCEPLSLNARSILFCWRLFARSCTEMKNRSYSIWHEFVVYVVLSSEHVSALLAYFPISFSYRSASRLLYTLLQHQRNSNHFYPSLVTARTTLSTNTNPTRTLSAIGFVALPLSRTKCATNFRISLVCRSVFHW